MAEEDRKLEEMRKKKSNREYWEYLKGPEDREQKKVHELCIEDKISTNTDEQRKYIKELWEKIGRKKSNDKGNIYRIMMQRRNIAKEQNYKITKEDIKKQIKKLKNMKAVGPDGIPNEFYKEGEEKIEEGLLDLFGSIDEEEEVPIEWNEVQVNLSFKHGTKEKRDIKNYRPVAVANTISNIFCGIIKDKMTIIMEEEELIGEEQNGFRKDRRGTENLYVLKELIEKTGKENKQLYCMFLDIEKVYDTVNRKIMWNLVERLGFDEHIRKDIAKYVPKYNS